MDAIELSTPKPFEIPKYDFESVKVVASATNMQRFYNSLLDGTMETPVSDFTYGLSPQMTKALQERLVNEFDWGKWVEKMENMGAHYTVRLR